MTESSPELNKDRKAHIREAIKTADIELEKYAESLQFGTPKFLAFADVTASSNAIADMRLYGAQKDRLEFLGLTPEEAVYPPDRRRELQDVVCRVEETSRVNENTVPGYLLAKLEFTKLYQDRLRAAENARFALNTPREVVNSKSELRKNPAAYLDHELGAEADKALCNKLEAIRGNVIKKG